VSSDPTYVGAVEIGGQHVASFVAGLLAAQNPAFTGTRWSKANSRGLMERGKKSISL